MIKILHIKVAFVDCDENQLKDSVQEWFAENDVSLTGMEISVTNATPEQQSKYKEDLYH